TTVSATADALWLEGKLSRKLACDQEGPRNFPALGLPGRTRLTSRLISVAKILLNTTASTSGTTIARRCGSSCHTSAAATAVQTNCPYCASQRLSRLMSPLNDNPSVVGSPRLSNTISTAQPTTRAMNNSKLMWAGK